MNTWSHALEVVKALLKAGVREFVVCAGARNAALLEALARAEAGGLVQVWRHFEERSAGFFALGRTMETALPCAVVTTSGTAAAELLPAIIEAFYQIRPLVAITADRPAAFRGSGAPQVIEQSGLFGTYAFAGNLAAWDGRQPLHLNVELEETFEFGDESFTAADRGEFLPPRERINVASLARWLHADIYLGTVVLVGGLEPDEREDVLHFCQALGAPVLADATSGLREALHRLALPDGDRLLQARPPGRILRLGDVPSGRFWRDLENLTHISVWSVCRNGLPGLARPANVIRGSLDRVLAALGEVEHIGDALDYLPGCSRRAAMMEELLETYPDSEPSLLRSLSQYVSLGSGLFLGNSLPIREWNLFAQMERPVPSVRANRGANGIDGQISTWLGWSANLTESWALLGDLTTLYDLAAPFVLGQIECRGRVLAVINNGGGRIFGHLPHLQLMSPRAAEWMTNPQTANLAGLATLWGMAHLRIRTPDDFDRFPEAGGTTLLLELIPDSSQTQLFWAAWNRLGAWPRTE